MPPYKESLYAVLRLIKYTEDNYICQMVMGHQRRRKDYDFTPHNKCEVYKIIKKEQIEFFKEKGLLNIEYIDSKCIYCSDSIGYKYKINFTNFSKRGKLPHLFRGNPFVIQNIKKYLSINNSSLVLISKEYQNCKQKLKFVCKNHIDKGIQEIALDKIVHRNHECKYCAYENIGKQKQIRTDKIIKRCNELGIDYVGRYSFNGETWVKYICPEHYYKGIQKVAWYHLKTCVAKCPYCTGRYKTTNDFIKEMQQVNSDIEIIGEYIGSDFPVKCKCKKCKHIWSPIGRSLKYGQGCPVCKNSKGEKQILNFLTKQKIDFEIEKKFEDCKNARMLRFDFYLPTYNLCIEYDGEQHFSPIDFANKGSEWANSSFNQNQKRDEIKNQYCKNHNIQMLRIPYWEINNIENILSKNLGVKS